MQIMEYFEEFITAKTFVKSGFDTFDISDFYSLLTQGARGFLSFDVSCSAENVKTY